MNKNYVLYWMQAAQRVHFNPALDHAVRAANGRRLPLLVYFGLDPAFPEANLRSYSFMLEGIEETRQALSDAGIAFALKFCSPPDGALELAAEAELLVCDSGYTRIQKQWRERILRQAPCPVDIIETEVVVPVKSASGKEEYMARTLRPKINRLLAQHLIVPETCRLETCDPQLSQKGIEWGKNSELIRMLSISASPAPSPLFRGGSSRARERLKHFLANGLPRYEQRNDPLADASSHLSPYLHFGQISPLEIALAAQNSSCPAAPDFLEELVVRRELAVNFVFYNENYDRYSALPEWARKTLEQHRGDPRPYEYELAELENAKTHDPAWNAAQNEMLETGYMSSYLRMYWGKKILEWHQDPGEAFAACLYLNNKYELDGRDPNAYAGVAWCFGKHDRPWPERPIFGTVRTMTDTGMARKFDLKRYIARFNPN